MDDLAVDHRDRPADFVALAELPGDDAAADNVASLFESERKILTRATENANNALAAANRQYSTELSELQRKAIATSGKSALATLQLVEAIRSASNSAEAADMCLDHLRGRTAALTGIALDFFDSALSLIGALSLARRRLSRSGS